MQNNWQNVTIKPNLYSEVRLGERGSSPISSVNVVINVNVSKNLTASTEQQEDFNNNRIKLDVHRIMERHSQVQDMEVLFLSKTKLYYY